MRGKLILINLFLIFLPGFCLAESDLVINEVFYDTQDTKEEFIELYNNTGNDIELKDYYLKDTSKTGKYVFDSYLLKSAEFLILATDEDSFKSLFNFRPDLSNLNFGLNNGGDRLKLFNSKNELLDEVGWESENDELKTGRGDSLERSPVGQDSDSSNDFIISSPPTPGVGLIESPLIEAVNVDIDNARINYSWQGTGFSKLEVYLNKGEGFYLTNSYLDLPDIIQLEELDLATYYQVKLIVYTAKSRSSSDIFEFNTAYDFCDGVIINEVYPNPDEGEQEWVELYNDSDRLVDLTGWSLADKVKSYQIKNLIIKPKSYLLIKKDLSGISLNNSGDEINLIYPDGSLSDKTNYGPTDKGVSWARNEDIFRFTFSVTPGAKNKFTFDDEDKQNNLTLISIKEALNSKEGQMVKINGLVNVPPSKFGGRMIYLEDKTAGIQIYFHHSNWPKFNLGSRLELVGEISRVRGEKRIKISDKGDIIVVSKNEEIIKPKRLDWSKPSNYIGKLVKVRAEVSSSAGSTFYLEKKNINLKVYLKESAGIDKPKTYKGSLVEVIGILTKTDSGYKLLPRFSRDIKLLSSASQGEVSLVSNSKTTKNFDLDLEELKSSPTVKASYLGSTPVDYRDSSDTKDSDSAVNNSLYGYLLLVIGSLGVVITSKLSFILELLEIRA